MGNYISTKMDYEKPTERPEIGKFFAYKGLQTGERQTVSHVVKNGKILFEFCSSLEPTDPHGIGEHVKVHGDGVKDVAFHVDDAKGIYEKAVSRGAKGVLEPKVLEDEHGSV